MCHYTNDIMPECQTSVWPAIADCQKNFHDRMLALWYATHVNVIAIANQKGGTAKTTSAAALGVQLSRAGLPTHLIDMDPQASLGAAFGIVESESNLFRALNDQTALPITQIGENLTISASNIELLRGETEFLARPAREFVLKSSLEETKLPRECMVLVDCPPSLGVLSIACLTAASHVMLVVQPGGFELKTIVHLRETTDVLRTHVNPQLEILGALMTNCHRRRRITEHVAQELSTRYRVLGQIRADARLVNATTAGRIYDLSIPVITEDYGQVASGLIKDFFSKR